MYAAVFLYLRKGLQIAAAVCLFVYTICCLYRFLHGKNQKMQSRSPECCLSAYKNDCLMGSEVLEKGDFILGNQVLVPEPNFIRVRGDGWRSPRWQVRLEIGDKETTLTVMKGRIHVEGQALTSGSPPVKTDKFTINGVLYHFKYSFGGEHADTAHFSYSGRGSSFGPSGKHHGRPASGRRGPSSAGNEPAAFKGRKKR